MSTKGGSLSDIAPTSERPERRRTRRQSNASRRIPSSNAVPLRTQQVDRIGAQAAKNSQARGARLRPWRDRNAIDAESVQYRDVEILDVVHAAVHRLQFRQPLRRCPAVGFEPALRVKKSRGMENKKPLREEEGDRQHEASEIVIAPG